jgi:hypothetical protein
VTALWGGGTTAVGMSDDHGLEAFTKFIAGRIEAGLPKADRTFEVRPTAGPIIYVKAVGAEGDLTLAKELRPVLAQLALDAVYERKPGFRGQFDARVSTSNKGDDLWFTVEIIYP